MLGLKKECKVDGTLVMYEEIRKIANVTPVVCIVYANHTGLSSQETAYRC